MSLSNNYKLTMYVTIIVLSNNYKPTMSVTIIVLSNNYKPTMSVNINKQLDNKLTKLNHFNNII